MKVVKKFCSRLIVSCEHFSVHWLTRWNVPTESAAYFVSLHARSYRCTDEKHYSTKYFQLQLIIQKY